MEQPLSALLIGTLLLGLVCFVFWPRWGLIARWQSVRRMSQRIRTEDALKDLFKRELAGEKMSLERISGSLRISDDRAMELLEAMQEQGLITWEEDCIKLTSDGRDYALHIVRAHRLWERYLADQTGYVETEWHAQAERFEHDMTPEAVRDLSASLGHPTHDPHGDPIPGRDGHMVRHGGLPLTKNQVGDLVRIVHIEDEPASVYAQLVAERLTPGMILRVLEKSPQRIRFWAEGDEHVLAPVLANNISVVAMPEEEGPEAYAAEHLSALKPGEHARVVRLSRACRGVERRRLLDLGLTPGTLVEAEFQSPSGDPIAFRIRGALIALRREQSSLIHIERIKKETYEHATS